jgi:hypothetical protein
MSEILTAEKQLHNFNNKWIISDTLFYNGTPCHIWIACKDDKGYGNFSVNNRMKRAHRVSYATYHRKEIPPSLQIDHLCRINSCINPSHLEVVTLRKNVIRGASSILHKNKTSIFTGVSLSPRNKWIWSIVIDGTIRKGQCDTEEEARDMYQHWLKKVEEADDISSLKHIKKTPTSHYKGVSWSKSRNKWVAQRNGKNLGRYNTEEEAHQVYENNKRLNP